MSDPKLIGVTGEIPEPQQSDDSEPAAAVHETADPSPWLQRITTAKTEEELNTCVDEASAQRVSFAPEDMAKVRTAFEAKLAELRPAAPPEAPKDRAARRKRDAAERASEEHTKKKEDR
jgi:hypothetical protein